MGKITHRKYTKFRLKQGEEEGTDGHWVLEGQGHRKDPSQLFKIALDSPLAATSFFFLLKTSHSHGHELLWNFLRYLLKLPNDHQDTSPPLPQPLCAHCRPPVHHWRLLEIAKDRCPKPCKPSVVGRLWPSQAKRPLPIFSLVSHAAHRPPGRPLGCSDHWREAVSCFLSISASDRHRPSRRPSLRQETEPSIGYQPPKAQHLRHFLWRGNLIKHLPLFRQQHEGKTGSPGLLRSCHRRLSVLRTPATSLTIRRRLLRSTR